MTLTFSPLLPVTTTLSMPRTRSLTILLPGHQDFLGLLILWLLAPVTQLHHTTMPIMKIYDFSYKDTVS